MSKISIKSSSSGTATFTIESPATNTDRVLVLPDVTGGEFIVSNASGNVGIGTSSPGARLDVSSGVAGVSAGDLVVDTEGVPDTRGGIVFIGRLSDNASDNSNLIIRDRIGRQMEINPDGGEFRIRTLGAFNLDIGTNSVNRMRIDADGAIFRVIPGGSTLFPDFACRAFVNFNGTGTVAIRASGNVSSITDNGVGDYTINFATAMPDANYSAVGASGDTSSVGSVPPTFGVNSGFFAGAVRFRTTNFGAQGFADHDVICISIFR